jgi:hypothetical protein
MMERAINGDTPDFTVPQQVFLFLILGLSIISKRTTLHNL